MSTSPTAKKRMVRIAYGSDVFDVLVSTVPGERLSISVHPDMRVTATAPAGQPFEAVVARLRKRASWMVRQRLRFARLRPLPTARCYVSGETFLYLGRQYRLRVRSGDDQKVCLSGGYINVTVANPNDADRVREVLRQWCRQRAATVLRTRLGLCQESARSLGVQLPTVVLRNMRTRWGSCTRNGKILLNPDLVRVSRQCIDYVILHEICHLKVMGHDPKFYRLLRRYLPDWEHWKRRLDAFVLPEW